jgi:hypothetical protein
MDSVFSKSRCGPAGGSRVVAGQLEEPTTPCVLFHRSLTQEAFDRLLDCLADEREAAGQKYLEIRSNLIRFFEWRGCPFPEDHADETVNRVARRLSEGEELRNPSAYFIGVEPVEPTGDEPQIECLQQCLGTLSSENRELILQYYQGEKSEKIRNRKQLTTRLGVPLNTLRMRALRLRERLQGCVEQCVSETGV